MPNFGRKITEKLFPWFMTWSLRRLKLWGLFSQILKVQSSIYLMVGWNKLYLNKWFMSYSHGKCLILVVEREGDRETKTNTGRVRNRDMSCIFLGLLWHIACYCLMMLRVTEYPHEDPEPLPGPWSFRRAGLRMKMVAIKFLFFSIYYKNCGNMDREIYDRS